MLTTFFHNMTLIITFTYFKIKVLDGYMDNKSYTGYLVWVYSLLNGLLSVILMMNHTLYESMIFDLRHAPIFISGYLFGLKGGLAVIIAPLLYRLYLGGANTWNGILIGILIPAVVGAACHPLGIQTLRRQINIKRIILAFALSEIIRNILFFIRMEMPLWSKLYMEANLTIFSFISIFCIVIMLNDQISRIKNQKKLKSSEERYKKLVELLPDPLLVSKGEEIVYTNSAAVKLLGYTDPSEILHRSLDEVVLPHIDYYHAVMERRQLLNSSETQTPFIEQIALLNNGLEIDIEVGSTSFEHRGDYYAINILRDINERKKLERRKEKIDEEEKHLKEALEYDTLKTEFFANLSHELKTPLNLIFSTIQLLGLNIRENEVKMASLEKTVGVLKQNCFRMMKLVNNLIDITKMESGYFELELQEANIVQVVEDIVMSVAQYIENKNLNLLFDTEMEERYMFIDLNSIERIILNLLSNAVKFTKTGGEIFIRMYQDESQVFISIKDTGVGIPKDKQGVIFDRFRQVDKSLTRNHEGSGIGLSLVKSLVALHGGNISLESNPSRGTEFIIALPVRNLESESIPEDQPNQMNLNNNVEFVNIEFSDIYGFCQTYGREKDSVG